MIRHQAIRPDFDIDILKQLGRKPQVRDVVAIVEECSLTSDATLGNVVWIAWNDQPGKSGHCNLTITCLGCEVRSGEAAGHATNMPQSEK